jgi:hypothetical protein
MNCPFCNKEINGLTGLHEILKFKKHLTTCKKNPERYARLNKKGILKEVPKPATLLQALEIRANSGQ